MGRFACVLLSACTLGCTGLVGSPSSPPEQPPEEPPLVPDTNQAPVARAGLDLSVVPGVPVVLDGAASEDADGDALSFSWAQASGEVVALVGRGTARASFVAPPTAGVLVLRFALTVSDGKLSATDEVEVTVRAEVDVTRPTVQILSPSAGARLAQGALTVTGVASDNAALDRVEVVLDNGSARAATGTSTWKVDLAAAALLPGSHEVVARAYDAAGNVGAATVQFTVESPVGPGTGFRFLAWGDTKSGTSVLAALSNQAKALAPRFAIYGGDLESTGFTQAGMDKWKAAMNGGSGNGMFELNFPTRGNHDSSNSAGWQGYFDTRAVATRVGATNYSALAEDLTYSFDYGNAHFVSVDATGDNTQVSAAELAWLDADLTAAAARGKVHAFLYWHGPIYAVANHCCPVNLGITELINKHPIVSATFHGHEHTLAHVHISKTRVANVTREFEMFISGSAGAGPTACTAGRADTCVPEHGFMMVDVVDRSFTVNFYKSGTTAPVKTLTFTKP